ncbi:MAG: hypothetical protein ACOY7U_02235 [Acidobacteriota bacterium]
MELNAFLRLMAPGRLGLVATLATVLLAVPHYSCSREKFSYEYLRNNKENDFFSRSGKEFAPLAKVCPTFSILFFSDDLDILAAQGHCSEGGSPESVWNAIEELLEKRRELEKAWAVIMNVCDPKTLERPKESAHDIPRKEKGPDFLRIWSVCQPFEIVCEPEEEWFLLDEKTMSLIYVRGEFVCEAGKPPAREKVYAKVLQECFYRWRAESRLVNCPEGKPPDPTK